jgi:NADP-dependent aldehyde dehydrogenase
MTDFLPTVGTETSEAELEILLARATDAFASWSQLRAAERGGALTAIADHLDAAGDELIDLACGETHLSEARLTGELLRTTFQLRLFAEEITEGGYLDARIDHADPAWGMGPRPDIRRLLEPIGPVLVFAASNFPFAFSVAGGDTASALAAGCPVIVKAHSGHPELSIRTADIMAEAIASVGVHPGIFGLITGTQRGRDALLDARVKVSSFTGSIPGGRALFDLANSRPDPIPFYGELGSVNPTFVTRAAASRRGEAIASEFVASFTLGAGQFCTKPGILVVPAESNLIKQLAATTPPAAAPLLNDRIQQGFTHALHALVTHPDVEPIFMADEAYDTSPTPTLLSTSTATLLADFDNLSAERFGPAALVVTYENESEMLEIAHAIDGQLTATIAGESDDEIAPELVRLLSAKAGRVLWNQWPTGVTVTYAQQHGGPYPATTSSTSTSVGTAAISRFVRPVAYQNFPAHLLPEALREENPLKIPRRVDGTHKT